MKGRKKKPLAIVRMEGNPGKRRLPSKDEEVVAVPGAPKCPDWLNGVAKLEWSRVVPLMNAQGTLAQADMAIIAGYCNCYAKAVEYSEVKDLSDINDPLLLIAMADKERKDQSLALKYWARCQSMASLLGLSPSDRAKLSIPGKKIDDEMGELLDKEG
jgi:P27 family predicted phage terminase small subunit